MEDFYSDGGPPKNLGFNQERFGTQQQDLHALQKPGLIQDLKVQLLQDPVLKQHVPYVVDPVLVPQNWQQAPHHIEEDLDDILEVDRTDEHLEYYQQMRNKLDQNKSRPRYKFSPPPVKMSSKCEPFYKKTSSPVDPKVEYHIVVEIFRSLQNLIRTMDDTDRIHELLSEFSDILDEKQSQLATGVQSRDTDLWSMYEYITKGFEEFKLAGKLKIYQATELRMKLNSLKRLKNKNQSSHPALYNDFNHHKRSKTLDDDSSSFSVPQQDELLKELKASIKNLPKIEFNPERSHYTDVQERNSNMRKVMISKINQQVDLV